MGAQGNDSRAAGDVADVTDAVDDERRRARYLSFLDYLEELHRKQHPPVRDVAAYQDLRLGRADAPWGSGIQLTPGAPAWLVATLVPHPPAPVLPDNLADVVVRSSVGPVRPPTLRREAFRVRDISLPGDIPYTEPAYNDSEDDEELAAAQAELDAWIEHTWRPWSEAWHEAERGRSRYKALHRLRDRLEHDRDAFELVWGFGRLRWRHEQGVIDHPLLTVPVEVGYERSDGRLEVRPIGSAMVEMAFLADLPLADRDGYRQERDRVEHAGVDVWDPHERDPLLRSLLRYVDHDGVLVDGDSGRSRSSAPTVTPDWVLYCRRRHADYLGFLEAQRDLYRDGAAPIPTALASLVADDGRPPAGNGGSTTGRPDRAADDERLLPLEANEEQHHILERARRSAGVTVQGPPGTGKSHTIANLICHFVAHGQRVLVTAEKEQPLSVLRGKLPRHVRPLAIAAIGSDAASHTGVEQSIAAIQEAVRQPLAASRRSVEIDRHRGDLVEVGRQIAATRRQLLERHRFEVRICPPSVAVAGVRSPSDLARWLRESAPTFGYVPDRVEAGTPPPLTNGEFAELIELVRAPGPADLVVAAQELPPPDLPAGDRLAAEDAELAALRNPLVPVDVARAAAGSDDTAVTVDAASAEEVAALAGALDEAADWCRKVAGSWLAEVRNEVADPALSGDWSAFVDDLREEREVALEHARRLQAQTVVLPVDGPLPSDMAQALSAARERLAAGKGLGLTAPRAVRQVLAGCRVDDDPVTTVEMVDLCLAEAGLRAVRRRMTTRWSNQTERVAAPALPVDRPEYALGPVLSDLDWLLGWTSDEWPSLRERLAAFGITSAAQPDDDEVARLIAVIEAATARRRAGDLVAHRRALAGLLDGGRLADGAAASWEDLAEALAARDWARWDEVRAEVARLSEMRPQAVRFAELWQRFAVGAPRWAREIAAEGATAAREPADLAAAWHWRTADTWLRDSLAGPTVSDLQHRLDDLTRRRRKITEQIVTAKAWFELTRGFGDRQDRALQRFVDARKKLGKGHGKYAPRWRKEIRAALDTAKDAVPVWIMPVTRVIESFRPAGEPPFDVLIIDEASQVPLSAAPILGLARRTIVVGDDQQTSSELVGLHEAPVHELIEQYLPGIPDRRTVFDPGSSLYTLASARFHEGKVVLKEHFRSLPDIIGFSNHRYYHGRLIPLRDRPPRHGWRPLHSLHVPDGVRRAGTDVNEPEARAVAELVGRLVTDPAYDGMTMGVISLLGDEQAPLVHDLLLDRIGQDEFERRQLRCGEPPNFQGDERDVMILSLVVAPDGPDTTLRIGPMTRGSQERRVNVAASRARDQMWVVHSVLAEEFPHGDPRGELLRACAHAPAPAPVVDDLDERCETELEREVLRRIVARGYRRVKVQHVVGQYRIDIVVEGPDGRLAVECDGDAHLDVDTWEADRARQAVLERAGWTFERIAGSAYFRDPDAALEPLWQRLDELGIRSATVTIGASDPM